MLRGLVENSCTACKSGVLNSIDANSCRSPERMTTFGTEWSASRSAAFSAGNAAHESRCASWPHRDVNGTELTMNLNEAVPLAC
jgi:hypothetical protein